MEIRESMVINGKGLFSTKYYKKNEIIYVLSGEIFDHPTRETIYIGNNQHIYDSFGIFINHSFTPNIFINNKNVIALKDIEPNEELMFNYNDNEINMAAPFYVGNEYVSGNKKL